MTRCARRMRVGCRAGSLFRATERKAGRRSGRTNHQRRTPKTMKQEARNLKLFLSNDASIRRLLCTLPLIGLSFALPVGCSGVPVTDCQGVAAGGNSATGACVSSGGNLGAAAATSGGSTQASTSLPNGGDGSTSLHVPNGSFEVDEQPSSAAASAPPSGWTMLSSASTGNLLHALRGDGMSIPAAAEGQNLAGFDSLTASSYREAMSSCFPIQGGLATKLLYQVLVPATQKPAGTRAAVKLWYFQDSACSTPSAIRAADTQSANSNSTVGIWEPRQYAPSQPPPTDAVAAKVSIRAAYNAGTDCGADGTNCSADRLYFDAIDVEQAN